MTHDLSIKIQLAICEVYQPRMKYGYMINKYTAKEKEQLDSIIRLAKNSLAMDGTTMPSMTGEDEEIIVEMLNGVINK